MAPRVSVVIPAFQVERTIEAALSSAIRQTFTNLEIIVVDDGSTDGGISLVRACSDRRVRVVAQPNRGLSAARNTGIREARGEYVAFLDGDDIWLPEKLERQVPHLNRSPEVAVSFCRADFIDAAGRPLGMRQLPKLTSVDAADVLCNTPIKNGSTPLVRRRVFDAVRTARGEYFDESLRSLEDVECWLRMLLTTSSRLEGLPEVLVHYRTSAGGLTADAAAGLADFEHLLGRVRGYAPEFVARWERSARGYQLRYRAQRAILVGADRRAAARLMNEALLQHPAMLAENPGKTLLTLAAAQLSRWLPPSAYGAVQRVAFRGAGALQSLGFLGDRSRRT